MEIRSTDEKAFLLTDNGQQSGELHFESLFSFKAQIKLTNADTYDIKPVGVFATSILITKNATEIANLTMNIYICKPTLSAILHTLYI